MLPENAIAGKQLAIVLRAASTNACTALLCLTDLQGGQHIDANQGTLRRAQHLIPIGITSSSEQPSLCIDMHRKASTMYSSKHGVGVRFGIGRLAQLASINIKISVGTIVCL